MPFTRIADEYENTKFSNDSEDFEEDQYETNDMYLPVKRKNKVDFKSVFPSRNTFRFDNGITITSDFDSGNLMKCELIPSKFKFKHMPKIQQKHFRK